MTGLGVGEKDADGKEVEDVEAKKARWLGRRDGGTGAFIEFMCIILIIIKWSITLNDCKELRLQPAIIANDTFSSGSAHGHQASTHTHAVIGTQTHVHLFEAA